MTGLDRSSKAGVSGWCWRVGVAIGITAIQVLVEARAGDEISKTFRDNKPSADSAWFEPVKIMVNHKRHKRMLKLLSEHDSATVQQLMDWLSASAATVRRDIGWLAAKNQLTRTRGGAQKLQQKKRSFTLSSETFQNNIQNCAAEKRAIARYASTLCKDGETIIINGGTTTYMMVEFLVEKQLKILTNSFLMAERLLSTSDNEIILPGGKVYREQNVILSPFENDIAQHHYAAKMFMGVYGLSILGLMEADPLLIQAEKRLISQAEELIVLVDSSKFARKAGLILCGLNRVSCVITDTGASDSAVQLLEQYGVKVVTVEPEALACSRLDADADVQAMGSGGCDLDNDDDCETGDVRTGSFAPFKVAA